MEWHGVDDDDILVQILQDVPFKQSCRLRRLGRQMRRVGTRVLEFHLKLTPEQAKAFSDAMSGRNVFLTGGAGTF